MDGLSQVWHRRKNVQASTNKSQEKLENMMVWVAFFRANIEIFIDVPKNCITFNGSIPVVHASCIAWFR